MGHSTRLRLDEIRGVFHLLGEIRELAPDPVEWQRHMIFGLCRLTGAKQGAAIRWGGFTPTGDLTLLDFVPGGWSCPAAAKDWQQRMKEGNWRADPILDQSTHLPGLLATRLREQLVPDDQWIGSEADDISHVAEIDHHLIAFYRRREDQVSGIALHTDRHDRRFGLRQRAILHLFNVEMCRLYRQGKLEALDTAPRLSPRLRQLLDRLAAGDSQKQAARKLGLSRYTVGDYVKELYRRHGVNSRAELLAKVLGRK